MVRRKAPARQPQRRAAKPQPVLLSSEVSFARPFATASANDEVAADTAHYGTLSKTLLSGMELFSSPPASSFSTSGSGAETVAHLRENGRVTLMFSAFEGPPRIVRLFGTGASPRPPSSRSPLSRD